MKLSAKPCVFCGNPSSRSGEHVISRWLISDHPGQYFTDDAGTAIRNRQGKVRTHDAVPGAKLPCCTTCNEAMGNRWERTASDVMRRVDASTLLARPVLTPSETEALTLWFAKSAILLRHPDALHVDPDTNARAPRWTPAERALHDWMVNGQDPPTDLSVFLSREARSATAGLVTHSLAIYDTLTDPLGNVYQQRCGHIGIRELSATVVYHPGWPSIVHPLVAHRAAVQLWPVGQFGPLDMNAILPVHPDDAGAAIALAPSATLKVDRSKLPPLEAGVDLSDWIA